MLGFLTAYDENEKQAAKEKISFIHIESSEENEEEVKLEVSRLALIFARKFDLEKVFLFYGKDKKIIYDYSIQS